MKASRVITLAALCSLPMLATAGDYPRPKMDLKLKDYQADMTEYNFPSGLRVIFQEDHSQPVVSITSVTDRGSTADPASLEGIAHVCEHIWFRSRHKTTDGSFLPKVWDMLEALGANLNAFTADDQTVYMTVVPSHNLVPVLRMEGWRMTEGAAGVTQEIIDVEKEVVRNELRMRYENSVSAFFGHLMVNLYPKDHPYGRAAYAGIGSHETLNNIKLKDVQDFFTKNYTPDKTTIFVVGDFKLKDAGTLVQELGMENLVDPKNPKAEMKLVENPKPRVSGPAPEPPAPPTPAEVKGAMTGVTQVRGPVDKTLVALGWSVPAGWRETEPMMQMAANQIGEAINEELGLSGENSAGCGFSGQVEGSMIYCVLETASKDEGVKLADKALNGIYRVWATDEYLRPFQDKIFNLSKYSYMASLFQSVDTISSLDSARVTSAAQFAHYTGSPQYFTKQFEALNKVQPDQVRKFSAKYITRARAVAVVMEPYDKGDLLEDSSDSGYRGASREDRVGSLFKESELTPSFIRSAITVPDLKPLQKFELGNKMKVVVYPYSNGPLVQARLDFRVGTASFPFGQGEFALDMEGSRSAIDQLQLLRIAGFSGSDYGNFGTNQDISASAGNIEEVIFTLRDRIENVIPDTNYKLDWVKSYKKGIITSQKQPDWWAGTLQKERLFPGHLFSKWMTHADIDAAAKMNVTAIGQVLSKIYRPENATLLIVGNVDAKQVEELARTYFGGWAGYAKPPADTAVVKEYAPPPAPPERQVLLFNKENSSQSDVNYLCQIAPVAQDTYAASQVLGSYLSEGAWLALREDSGKSYGAYAYTQSFQGGVAILGMTSLVQNDAAPLAVKSFLRLGEEAKNGKVDPYLMALRKYNIAQGFVLDQQSTAQMLDRLGWVYNRNYGLDFFSTYPDQLSNVTVPQLQSFMDRCVGHEVITVVGPVATIKPYFDKEGIKVEVFDWDTARKDYATKNGVKVSDDKKEDDKKKK